LLFETVTVKSATFARSTA